MKGGIEKDVRIYPVSAKLGLSAAIDNDVVLWERSGLSGVSDNLVTFLADEKTAIIEAAIRKKASVIIKEVLLRKALEVRSLELPLSDLEQKLELFRAKVDGAQLSQVRTKDVLTGDQKRIIERLKDTIAKLRNKAEQHFVKFVLSRLEQNGYQVNGVYDTIAEEIP